MKKSRKLLCVLLAAVMIFSMLSVMAFAADEDVAAEETVPLLSCPTIWSS